MRPVPWYDGKFWSNNFNTTTYKGLESIFAERDSKRGIAVPIDKLSFWRSLLEGGGGEGGGLLACSLFKKKNKVKKCSEHAESHIAGSYTQETCMICPIYASSHIATIDIACDSFLN